MILKIVFMRSCPHSHTAIFFVSICDSYPSSDPVMWFKTNIFCILVKTNKTFSFGFYKKSSSTNKYVFPIRLSTASKIFILLQILSRLVKSNECSFFPILLIHWAIFFYKLYFVLTSLASSFDKHL